MIYSEAVSYIRNIERAGSDYGIERMRLFLDILGKPDEKLKFVHVAGTNGKGSVCAYMTAVLVAAGYKVGTYNSPSVFSYNERWRINGEPFSDELVAKYLTKVKTVIDGINAYLSDSDGSILNCGESAMSCEGSALNCDENTLMRVREFVQKNIDGASEAKFQLTAFEIETAVALLAFSELNCDIAVLETGLGGRWDATNAIAGKEVAIITPIGLDHCALLGNTLGEIASEKAAIIKDVAVTCEQCDEIMREIANPFDIIDGERIYRQVSVKICENPIQISHGIDGQSFEYGGRKYEIGLLGKHQLQNAAIAICAVEELRKRGWNIPESAIFDGLKNAEWSARLEVVKNAKARFDLDVPSGKILVFDGAHNPHGAKALAQAIKDYFGDKRIHLVMGMLADKDVDGVVELLAPLATRATAVTPNSPRALGKLELNDKIMTYLGTDTCDTIRSAVQNALDGDCDVVVLCGSLTLFSAL